MKTGIVTLVSNNYGNKFQNYAVERVLSQYGEVETIRIASCGDAVSASSEGRRDLSKLAPSYIKQVLRSRLMYKYDITNASRSVLASLIFAERHKASLRGLLAKRSEAFKRFEDEYLHISDRVLTKENASDKNWLESYDFFVCGSDQIWNPNYSTTNELAFLKFAQGRAKTAALAPSFGVSCVPDSRTQEFADWIAGIDFLSVREDAGKEIIKQLTGRDAEVLLDPTMLISTEEWRSLAKAPDKPLPKRFVLCYFLGMRDKGLKAHVQAFASKVGLPVVMLFDVESPEYYVYGPQEVLFALEHADYVLTDSFHGSVFSILLHKQFYAFERKEGGASMSSRLDTLLSTFGLEGRRAGSVKNDINEDTWNEVEKRLLAKRNQAFSCLAQASPK